MGQRMTESANHATGSNGAVASAAVVARMRTAQLRRESVCRVVDFLDSEADHSADPMTRALWRRLAANTRRETLVSPDR